MLYARGFRGGTSGKQACSPSWIALDLERVWNMVEADLLALRSAVAATLQRMTRVLPES